METIEQARVRFEKIAKDYEARTGVTHIVTGSITDVTPSWMFNGELMPAHRCTEHQNAINEISEINVLLAGNLTEEKKESLEKRKILCGYRVREFEKYGY